MAERLGTGLQNLGQRFDSASHLKKRSCSLQGHFFVGMGPAGQQDADTPGPRPEYILKFLNNFLKNICK